ncbi:bZIP transcription factor [Aspergillus puulaauensis]|uniref:BZIP domain-containing protein n=1 Tax=Aspergillus puulaauensis TaxID=1220207 RepID=A0A7R8AJJ0_9EURO|nr:uncharacterized protein APUU_20137A [Aspergillus puulaauensis]BCS19705.1 hypothetical protein APUU_20137A [Aspergillus puulaauensis]
MLYPFSPTIQEAGAPFIGNNSSVTMDDNTRSNPVNITQSESGDSLNPSLSLQSQDSHGPSLDISATELEIDNPSGGSRRNVKAKATPSASLMDKRKAQNQAAQRAFRERKECHIRDLNDRFAQLQQNVSTLHEENDEKRQEITTALAENNMLKELESTSAAVQDDFMSVFPYTSFADLVAPGDHDKQPKHRLVTDPRTGERLMGLHTTWEFIQQDPRFQEGVLDLEKICNYLREQVQCDGQGPVFVERCVLDALDASIIGM